MVRMASDGNAIAKTVCNTGTVPSARGGPKEEAYKYQGIDKSAP